MLVTAWTGTAEDGETISLRAPGPLEAEHRRSLEEIWPPVGLLGPEAADAIGHPQNDAAALAVPVHERSADAPGWARLESDLALFAAEHLVGRVAVHAALATWRGRSVLLPGPSHAGKSTLALALADLGATVHGDDLAIIDPATGSATGWDRPMRRRRPDGGVDRVPLAAASDRTPTGPVAIDLVAVLRHWHDADGDDAWRALQAADAVALLLANTVNARRAPDLALDAALAVARRAVAFEGVRGEAGPAARALLGRLDRPGPTPQP